MIKYILLILIILQSFYFFYTICTIKIHKRDIMDKVEKINLKENKLLSQLLSKNIFIKLKNDIERIGVVRSIAFIGVLSLISIVMIPIGYRICLSLFRIKSVALILAVHLGLVPFIIVKELARIKQNKIEEILVHFLTQLASSLRINNDIVEAFRSIQNICMDPIRGYVKHFLVEINSGVAVDKALYTLSNKVNIKRFSIYINNLKYCSIYGGDTEGLTKNTSKLIDDLIKERKKREKETKSACVILYGLIILDLIIYFNMIVSNGNYIVIMRENFIGQIIVNINFISICVLVWLSFFVKKLDY